METVSVAKNKIEITLQTVSDLKVKTLTKKQEDVIVNKFLDSILDFKAKLTTTNTTIEAIIEGLETLTWVQDFTPECTDSLNLLLSKTSDLHHRLIKRYVSFTQIRKHQIATEEIKAFKEKIDYLKEVVEDVRSVFFDSNNDPELIDIKNKLENL
jgi:hypothetical protein